MSDPIGHECGIGVIRLLKPIDYYAKKYGTALYGFKQLFLLLEKQHNRGQDGAGLGCIKLDMPAGQPFLFQDCAAQTNPLGILYERQIDDFERRTEQGLMDPDVPGSVKAHFDFGGEVLMGHLRYATSGTYQESCCHPYCNRSGWTTKNLLLLGNFNMTSRNHMHRQMIQRGQHPIFQTDTQAVLEEVVFHLEEEHDALYRQKRDEEVDRVLIPQQISEELNFANILQASACHWDGGYVIAGAVGNGDVFVLRDPHGIRPCYYFKDEEIIAFASERPPLMILAGSNESLIREVRPGQAIIIKKNGAFIESPIQKPGKPSHCSFERIYFSRGNDPDIYRERKALGKALVPRILERIEVPDTVFSYIPNTAEIAYYGLMEGLRLHRRNEVKTSILKAQADGTLDEFTLDKLILHNWPREEKVAHKDIKLRTFISQEKSRGKLASHVYDITPGLLGKKETTLVVLDDSIVRGTTLRQSILKILMSTGATKIIIVSTAPQIRYPDCYGIDMSELGKFVAFQAAIALLKKRGQSSIIDAVYKACCEQKGSEQMLNHVSKIYEPFTAEEISQEIVDLVYPPKEEVNKPCKVEIIFQSIEALHKAIPKHRGDWYFTGKYPTPGGYAVLNQAFINYYKKKNGRSYD